MGGVEGEGLEALLRMKDGGRLKAGVGRSETVWNGQQAGGRRRTGGAGGEGTGVGSGQGSGWEGCVDKVS